VAWILDGDSEQPLPARQAFAYASGGVTELAAAQSIELEALIATQDVESLPRGEYGLKAVLMGINLASGIGRLRLT
jgi:hypothetical protein